MRTLPMLPLLCSLLAASQPTPAFQEVARSGDRARLQALQDGRPIWGRTVLVPLDATGRPLAPAAEPVAVAEGPRMDAEAAIARTLEDLALPFQAVALEPPRAEEVVFPTANTGGLHHLPGPQPGLFRLDLRHSVLELPPPEAHVPAWRVRTRHWDPLQGLIARDTVVEARTGRILRKDPDLRFAAELAEGLGYHAGRVRLAAERLNDGRLELRDATRPTQPHPLQAQLLGAGQPAANLVHSRLTEGTRLLFRTATAFGDGAVFNFLGPVTPERLTGPNGQTAAVDVAWGLQVTWDLLHQVLGRRGPDGQGGGLVAEVHANLQPYAPYANAYWDTAGRTLHFGDGGSGYLPFTSLDVVAHELGHALMSATADLAYSGEPGGLSEATSDILAMAALCYAAGGATGPTLTVPPGFPWLLGTSLHPEGRPLRSLKQPSSQGMMDAWFDGMAIFSVYANSGPASRCFYYLSMGHDPLDVATASAHLPRAFSGIGITPALRTWVRALEAHLTDRQSGYDAMRQATLAAAGELFGATSPERAAVENAWAAVNVGPPAGEGTAPRLRLAPGPWPGGLGSGIHTSSSRDVYVGLGGAAPLPQVVLEGFSGTPTLTWSGGYAKVDPIKGTLQPSSWNLVGWSTSFEVRVNGTPHRAMGMLHPVALDMDGDGEVDASDAAVLAIYSLSGVLPDDVFTPATLQVYFPPDPAIYRWNRAFQALLETR